MKSIQFIFLIILGFIILNSTCAFSKEANITWLQEEAIEKNKILESFWNERIVKYNQKSVDDFKRFIINTHYPGENKYEDKTNNLFNDAVSKSISYQEFYDALNDVPLSYFRIMNNTENLTPENHFEETYPDIKADDLENIKQYIRSKNLSVSLTLGSANETL